MTGSILTDWDRIQLRTKREVSVSVMSSYVRTTFSSPRWTSEHTHPPVWSTLLVEAMVEALSTGTGDIMGEELELQDCSDRPERDLCTMAPGRCRISYTYGLKFFPLLSSCRPIICVLACACPWDGEEVCHPFLADAAVSLSSLEEVVGMPSARLDIEADRDLDTVFNLDFSHTFADRSSNRRALMMDKGLRVQSLDAADVAPLISENKVRNSK
jgi:hypothetical protein